MVTEAEIDALLASTDSLLLNVFTFQCTGHSMPGTSHRGAAVAYQDILERKDDFLRELKNTMCSWVYSKKRYNDLFQAELKERGWDVQNAGAHLQTLARQKFRTGYPQGQFGELLLFNLLQHYFRAVPLLRKMRITTNPGLERHGTDAIHFRPANGQNFVYLGEAKTYSSKYKFKSALDDAVESMLNSFAKFSTELNLYVYDDFIEDELQEIAGKIKRNTLPNVVYELVCIISYEENEKKKAGKGQAEIEASIRNAVDSHILKHQGDFAHLDQVSLSRIHFIFFPFWELDKLLSEFDS